MNCDSCDEPKNSRIAAITGLALTKSCGMAVDISWYTLIFSLMARSIRTRPMRNWFSSNSPTARTRRLPRWSIRSEEHTSELQSHSDLVCRLLLEKKKKKKNTPKTDIKQSTSRE